MKITYSVDAHQRRSGETSAALLQRAAGQFVAGDLTQAAATCRQVLGVDARNVEARMVLALICGKTRDFRRSLELLDEAIALRPGVAEAHANRGMALQELGDWEAALASHRRAIDIDPRYALAHNNLGAALQHFGQRQAALESYDRAIALGLEIPDVYLNRGLVLNELGQEDAALDSLGRALRLNPEFAEAHYNRGVILQQRQQFGPARASYEKAIAVRHRYVEAHCNLGVVLYMERDLAAAVASYDHALAVDPACAAAFFNRGNAQLESGRIEAALESYARAVELEADIPWLPGVHHYLRLKLCDWRDFAASSRQLRAAIEAGEPATPPFIALALADSPQLHRQAAEIWVREECPPSRALPGPPRRAPREKIRVAYFSADFRHHAVTILSAGLYEMHDRSKFEVIALSFGPDTQDEARRRLEAAFDRFIDVRAKTDRDIALLARELEVDIAVDLGGFTERNRAKIFALRAAPLQVSYLGYLGTLGAPYMDYLIADDVVIPATHRRHYAEKLVVLPCYQVNDSRRALPRGRFTRTELGLPEKGFVFCCFNDPYKITPPVFESWMQILAKVEGSVLFLYAPVETARRNLENEAAARGIAAHRLVFGRNLPYADYLARYLSTDLFLDTLPYNGGTTASDALWAGVPVLTCAGESLAARVAASLLQALDLPELVTASPADYENLAVALATDPPRLARIKHALAQNRLRSPLFDTRRFAANLETAYQMMHRRHHAGLPPEEIDLSSAGGAAAARWPSSSG